MAPPIRAGSSIDLNAGRLVGLLTRLALIFADSGLTASTATAITAREYKGNGYSVAGTEPRHPGTDLNNNTLASHVIERFFFKLEGNGSSVVEEELPRLASAGGENRS